MIANGSLSAFSSPSAAGRAQAAGATARTGIERTRAATPAQQGKPQGAAPSAGAPSTGKILPRGSLLNLSV